MINNINKEKIINLLSEANKALEILKEYANSEKNELLESYKELSVVKYHFIILAEAAIDICNHISTKEYKEVAESYANCFEILKDHNLISTELGTKLSEFAKFRNVLVHLYWKVDDSIVVDKLSSLNVFEDFFSIIKETVKE